MFYNQYETIAKQRQQEVERISKEAWKFPVVNEDGLLKKVMSMFKASEKQYKANNQIQTCVTC